MRNRTLLLLIYICLPLLLTAQELRVLRLPNQEQLPSGKVSHVIQDSEGALWYATEGGGLCRDNGCCVNIFRSDAAQRVLLGDNKVACVADADGKMVVGMAHGAYVLDKGDFTIRRLDAVDDKRVDDILVMRNGDVLLTANRKIYLFSPSLQLKHTYTAAGKYVNRLFEDAKGRLWATLWDGGLLTLRNGKFVAAPWSLDASPTDIADAADGRLWIGTVGHGIVGYRPGEGTIDPQPATDGTVCTDLQPSADGRRLWASTTVALQCYAVAGRQLQQCNPVADMPKATGRLSLDRRGCLLVASNETPPVAIGTLAPWPLPVATTAATEDSLRAARRLEARPTAFAMAHELWFSTGHDIRRQREASAEEVVLPTKDVAAMTFTPDGTLWLGTIFGSVYAYKDGRQQSDTFASNEHGDAVIAMEADSAGTLTIAYNRYVRRYNPQRHTLRQQSIEGDGTYRIELAETSPGRHWSQPAVTPAVTPTAEGMSQWAWWAAAIVAMLIIAIIAYIAIKAHATKAAASTAQTQRPGTVTAAAKAMTTLEPDLPIHINEGLTAETTARTEADDEFLKTAVAQVEAHLSDDGYSVEQLATDLSMSRMTFYRKIQSATGQKPTEFVRTIRLQHAAALLRQGHLTVSQICYATGFASVSYFSRCFRAKYGVPPTQYAAP